MNVDDDPRVERVREEKARFKQRELGAADPQQRLIDAITSELPVGHPIRDAHERVAMVEALMLIAHRLGELTRHIAKLSPKDPPSSNGGPH